MPTSNTLPIYLELGARRVFAGALDWPGWCLSARDEAGAMQALLDAGPRYAEVLKGARLGFKAPKDVSAFKVLERLQGDATTDFGAPGQAPKADARPVPPAELGRLQKVLGACWAAFDAAVEMAQGQALAKGPRGGGRELAGILEHVLGAEAGYLAQLGGKFRAERGADPDAEQQRLRGLILEALAASVRGEIPATGPRGGKRWPPRYFVRRAAWHILDHVWEIEKRVQGEW